MFFPGSDHAGFALGGGSIVVDDESRRYTPWGADLGLPTGVVWHWTIEAAPGMGVGTNHGCEYQHAQHRHDFPISLFHDFLLCRGICRLERDKTQFELGNNEGR